MWGWWLVAQGWATRPQRASAIEQTLSAFYRSRQLATIEPRAGSLPQ
jgi:hypothetical protein